MSNAAYVKPIAQETYVLVLVDPNEGDLLGIWGPYDSVASATQAQHELEKWPLSPGQWEAIKVKSFTPAASSSPEQWNNVGTHNPANYSLDFFHQHAPGTRDGGER